MSQERQSFFLRVGALIIACTLLLTASFVGILALISGDIGDYQSRIPWYLVIGAIAFVGTIILLEENGTSGRAILSTAVLTSVLMLILIGLGTEGVIYTFENPDAVFVSQLALYFFSAGLIGTGLGYWGLKHWRELSGPSTPQGNQL